MMLRNLGADVIKIEIAGLGAPVGSLGKRREGLSPMFPNPNRNQYSRALDLKTPAGIAVLKCLVQQIDVFAQTCRLGVVDRHSAGELTICEIYPHIVCASISRFGKRVPWLENPVCDPIVQAGSGLAMVQGGSDRERPRLECTVLPDKVSALTAAQHVHISMLAAIVYLLLDSGEGAQTDVDDVAPCAESARFIDLTYGTQDGYTTAAIMSDRECHAVARGLDRPEWLDDARFSRPSQRDQHANERLK